jgi:hypothetical protein
MPTEFELSSRLVVWGDALDPRSFAERLGVDPGSAELTIKGEPLRHPDGTSNGYFAKTGRFILDFAKEYPERRNDPEFQLDAVAETLQSSADPISSLPGVDKAQLQLSFYYKVESKGKPDFLVPESLLAELVRNRLSLNVLILP